LIRKDTRGVPKARAKKSTVQPVVLRAGEQERGWGVRAYCDKQPMLKKEEKRGLSFSKPNLTP